MELDWVHFSPGSALAGGVLIGIAATLLWLFNGRIAGISGIVSQVLRPWHKGNAWSVAFLLGLVAAPLLVRGLYRLPTIQIDSGYLTLAVAGLLVGYGTRYGSGCTSGHGICGLSRLSPRSLIATLVFMAAGFITVYTVRHLWGV